MTLGLWIVAWIAVVFVIGVVRCFLRATRETDATRAAMSARNPGAPETVVPFGGTLGGGTL